MTGALEPEDSPKRSSYLVDRFTNFEMLEAMFARQEDKGKWSEPTQLSIKIQRNVNTSSSDNMKIHKTCSMEYK